LLIILIIGSFETFIQNVSDEEKIDIEKLKNIWNNNPNNLQISSLTKKETKKEIKKDDSDAKSTCPYIFSKGEKEGKSCSDKSRIGFEYCSKHKNYEGTGQVQKKKTPVANNSMANSSGNIKKKTPTKKPIELEKTFKLNKDINKYWNSSTQFFIEGKDSRIVIGSYRDNTLNSLTDDDIILCDKYGFDYDKNGFNKVEKKIENKVEKKIENKVDNIGIKKTISSSITETNIKAQDIENILKELQTDNGDDEDEFEEHFEEEEYDEDE